jgi:hypothetical protein
MIELTYQLACPDKSRNQAKYILLLISALTGIRLKPALSNPDMVYGDIESPKSVIIPVQPIAANLIWRKQLLDNLSISLPDSINGPLFDRDNCRFGFDIISVMGSYLQRNIVEHSQLKDINPELSDLGRSEFNDYIKLIILALKEFGKIPDKFQPLSPWPNNKPFALGVSHDIDILRRKVPGSLLMLANACGFGQYKGTMGGAWRGLIDSATSQLFGKQNPYCRFDRIIGKDWRSTIFAFAGLRNDSKDPTYDLNQLFTELKPYLNKFEIALHNGIGTWNSPPILTDSKHTLETCSGKKVTGIRPHYLDCRFPEFWKNLTNFEYSSSLGSDSIPGFIYGVNFPFHGFSLPDWVKLDIIELPIGLMDCALFSITVKQKRFNFIDKLFETCICDRGLLVIDWHNTSAYENDFPGWFEAYEYIIKQAVEKGAFIGSLEEISKIWRTHCRSVFSS